MDIMELSDDDDVELVLLPALANDRDNQNISNAIKSGQTVQVPSDGLEDSVAVASSVHEASSSCTSLSEPDCYIETIDSALRWGSSNNSESNDRETDSALSVHTAAAGAAGCAFQGDCEGGNNVNVPDTSNDEAIAQALEKELEARSPAAEREEGNKEKKNTEDERGKVKGIDIDSLVLLRQQKLDAFVIAGGKKKEAVYQKYLYCAQAIRDPKIYSGPLGIFGLKHTVLKYPNTGAAAGAVAVGTSAGSNNSSCNSSDIVGMKAGGSWLATDSHTAIKRTMVEIIARRLSDDISKSVRFRQVCVSV
jgi:hypothetical protein